MADSFGHDAGRHERRLTGGQSDEIGLPESRCSWSSSYAAQEPDSQENWHLRLADCFQVLGTGGEGLLPAKLKVSFPTFRWVSCGSGVSRLRVLSPPYSRMP